MRLRSEKGSVELSREGRLRADLTGASLEGVSLRQANLPDAVLDRANLSHSDLQGANLRQASLYRANLSWARMDGSNLGMADLRFASLERANLCRVNLHGANLLGANLAGACVENSDLTEAILPDGTHFTDEVDFERFTDEGNTAFQATLEAIAANREYSTAGLDYKRSAGGQSWAEFVEHTYGSLANDPIEWHPPDSIANELGSE